MENTLTAKQKKELRRILIAGILFAVLMTRVDYKNAQQKEQWLNKHFYY